MNEDIRTQISLSLTIGLVLLARFHYVIHCFATGSVVGARERGKSLDSGQKLIIRPFRDETKPTKHSF